MADTRSASDDVRRLRTIVIADVVLASGAGLFTLVMYFTVAPIPALFWVGLFVVATAGLIATSLRPLTRGDTYQALLQLSAANWLVAIGSTFVATFQWPIQVQVALLPIVLAATFVAATDRERRRIERDLHDGAQSRLVAINLKLAAARSLVATGSNAADAALDAIRHEVHLAHTELRDLAHGLYPTVLTQHGLVAAIGAVADRSPAPIRLDLQRVGRLPADIEAAIYFCVLEAVQNAAKYASAKRVDLRLGRSDGSVYFEVRDNGIGFATTATNEHESGHGLTNMRDRIGAIGGYLEVTSERGAGTSIIGTVPLDS